MDSPHTREYIEKLEIVREDGAELTEDDLNDASSVVNNLISSSMNFFMSNPRLLEGPSCTGLRNYKALYFPSGYKSFEYDTNPLGTAVYYFLRVPVYTATSQGLSPIKPRMAPYEFNYFKGEEAGKYLAFLHRWSAELTKCTGFFDYLIKALAQRLPADLLESINFSREHARTLCAYSSLRIGKLGAWIQPLAENTTVREFLTQLVQLAYYVNESNMWRKGRSADLGRNSPYYYYDGRFAGECIQMFYSFLMTSMSELRLEWLAAVHRGTLHGAAARSFKSSRTGPSWPGAGAGAGAGGPWSPRLALRDASPSPTWPGAGGPRPPPRLALKDAPASSSSASASTRYDLRKRGRGGGEGEEHGGRRNRSRHSSSKGRRHARSRSKCSIM
jgi:hypothetical protein